MMRMLTAVWDSSMMSWISMKVRVKCDLYSHAGGATAIDKSCAANE